MESVAPGRGAELRALYERVEPEVQAERPFRLYREVLAEALRRSARLAGVGLAPAAEAALAASLPDWPVFADVGPALGALRDAGHRIAVLSNVDPDLFAGTRERLPAEVDLVVTAADVESYKPGLAHFERFRELTGAGRGEWVHAACSWFHDVSPAHRLGRETSVAASTMVGVRPLSRQCTARQLASVLLPLPPFMVATVMIECAM